MTGSAVRLKKYARFTWGCIFLTFFVSFALAIDLPGLEYGRLSRDPEVTHLFETYQILSNHKYYTSGSGNIPYAIVAIHEKYNLRQGLWKEINITTQLLRSWVYQMDTIYGYRPYGSQILDRSGNPVGVWYSSKQSTTIIMEENNGVVVFAPEPPGFRGGK